MKAKTASLAPLAQADREQFILDNQLAFKYGALQEFGERDDHIDADGEIISRRIIEGSIGAPNSRIYRIMADGKKAGSAMLGIDPETGHNHLDILFVAPEAHNQGTGHAAWRAIEALYPETRVWETCPPYFEKRNRHFYVNKRGFRIAEFFNARNIDPDSQTYMQYEGPDDMFRLVRVK